MTRPAPKTSADASAPSPTRSTGPIQPRFTASTKKKTTPSSVTRPPAQASVRAPSRSARSSSRGGRGGGAGGAGGATGSRRGGAAAAGGGGGGAGVGLGKGVGSGGAGSGTGRGPGAGEGDGGRSAARPATA